MLSPDVLTLFFCLSAMVLHVLVTASSPVWDKISFLNVVSSDGQIIHFGVLGYTGSAKSFGYYFGSSALGTLGNLLDDNNTIHKLTFLLILHPIAAGFSGFAVIFGLCGATYSRIGTICMSLSAAFAVLITFITCIINMFLWTTVRTRIHHSGTGATATLGNANWLALSALAALVLDLRAGTTGACGRYRRRDKF